MNNTFPRWLKITLIVAGALIALKFWPLFALPVFLSVVAILLLAGLLAGGTLVAASVAVTLLTVTSPLWVPIAIIVGLIALLRRSGWKSVA